MRTLPTSWSLSLVGLCAVLCAPLYGQEPAAPSQSPPASPAAATGQEQPPPRFTTETNYVRLDVYPTRAGAPVLDLRVDEIEVLENGVLQKLESFEHVVVSPAGPQTMRVEANSVRGAEQMASNPRNRVFVVFLDIPHVGVTGSHAIKEPLIRLLERVLGPDDLVGVMTPEMSPAQITLGRKTEVIADMLRDRWDWGIRHRLVPMDEREAEYDRCYPPTADELRGGGSHHSGVTRQLIARRRERLTLDALRDLVRYLGSIREERKAIITVSSGWVLYRPDASITQLRVLDQTGRTEPVPGNEPIGVDPWGKLKVGGGRDREGRSVSQTGCDKERMYLASIDNDDYFRQILDVANRNNASFYPVDPRGLAAFDSDIGPERPQDITVDAASLRHRIEILRTLAENTDGMAVVNTNDLDRGLRRIADDLTSYYLLGYYSSNTKLDGQYRRISVRVKRPGVDVRARRGYRAATAEEVNASRLAAAAPVPPLLKTATAALSRLSRIQADQRLVLHVVQAPASTPGRDRLWVAGELRGPAGEFAAGGKVSLVVKGGVVSGIVADLKPGERSFVRPLDIQTDGSGIVDLSAELTSAAGGPPLSEVLKVSVTPEATEPLLFRRGPITGNRMVPAATYEFSRTERLQLQLPLAATSSPGTGRFLDRNAQPLQVPVQVTTRDDPDGQRWLVADATLSPLAAGDYIVELTIQREGSEHHVLTPLRVTR